MAIQVSGDTVIYNDKVFRVGSGTTAQRPVSPALGMIWFNTTLGSFEGYNGSEWKGVGGGAINDLFYENIQTVASSYTIPATKNAMTTGPITIQNDVSVTVSAGARWVVL
jgi:hypothetical protein